MNLAASGMIGFEPLVRVLSMSDGSPVPILKSTSQYIIYYIILYIIYYNFASIYLPVVRRHVDLVSRAAKQILQSVLLHG